MYLKKKYAKHSAVYGWVHKESFKTYVGSATDVSVRSFRHLQPSARTNIYSKNEINVYGLGCFVLVIFKLLRKTGDISSTELLEAKDLYLNLVFNK